MRKLKSNYLLWLLLVTSLAGIECSPSIRKQVADTTRQAQQNDSQEIQVWAALLNGLYIRDDTDLIVINGETSLDGQSAEHINQDLGFLKRGNWHGIGPDILNDFLAKNAHPRKLSDQFNLNVKVLILSKDEVAAIGQSRDNWKQFLAKYPGQSIITLSRPGFTVGNNNALVYTGDQSGGRTGRGQYVFLQRDSGSWVIKRRVAAWVS